MKYFCLILLFLCASLTISASEKDDRDIRQQCLQSLRQFMTYARSIYTEAGTDGGGRAVGYFKAKDAGRSTEDGVRTNADLAMVCAFVWQHDKKDKALREMSLKALRYATATHRANQGMKCTDGKYWGSMGDHWQWESSLWAYSVAMAARFLGEEHNEHVRRLIEAEADNALARSVLTGYQGDTKAEENGWDTNVLAVAAAFYPRHPHARQWQEQMELLAFNCYTVDADSTHTLYVGTNLFPDFTLQNHNYFHTSYQNVVIQELAESMLVSPKLFSKTLGLTHHWQEVWDEVLVQLALADGELAMPNGNDWSMFLYDQLPAYAAMATMLKSSDALLLERRCLDQLLKRQRTTSDGSYMLHPDIGPRRMGVTAHRVMMTYLMHRHFGTRRLKASTWDDFCQRMAKTKTFPSQQIVRSMSADRFACFSWSEGLKNATGIIVPNEVEDTKIIVPYKHKGTGNFLGCYNNAQTRLSGKPQFTTTDSTFQVRGRLMAAGGKVAQDFTFTADAHNGVIVEYQLMGNDTILQERGGTVAVSVDPFTKTERTLYYEGGEFVSDGSQLRKFRSNWVNIDNRIGIIVLAEDNEMAFGDRQLINSIQTARLYPTYSNTPQVASSIKRKYLYFTNQTAQQTRQMFQSLRSADAP